MIARPANLYEVRGTLACVYVVAYSIDEAIAKSAVVLREKTERVLRGLNPDRAIVANGLAVREVKLVYSGVIL